ncbi:MAG: c-type cytochrome [bacterium]
MKSMSKIKVILLILLLMFFYPLFLQEPAFAGSYGNAAREGKYLFHYYNCDDCHSINGVGGSLGPSLSNYGAIVPDFNWTMQQIKHPNSHFKRGDKISMNGKTYYVIMPSYDYIPVRDIKKIAVYLESLKNLKK